MNLLGNRGHDSESRGKLNNLVLKVRKNQGKEFTSTQFNNMLKKI